MNDLDRIYDILRDWRTAYEAQAEADGYREWIDDFAYLDDPLEAARGRWRRTADLLLTIVTYKGIDNSEDVSRVERFLRKQTYRHQDSTARYFVYFCGSPMDDVRICIDEFTEIDLVDIFDSVGFGDVGIGLRGPNLELEPGELESMEKAILADFYFDYGEEEISIVFDRWCTTVLATVRERARFDP